MQTLEGTRLGNYDIVRRIRVGGMGAVYEGRQRTAFGRRVAIKVILGNYAGDPDMRRRFAREARTIARLHHPHILPLIEFGDERGLLYLVMPFIEGGTLTSYLRRTLPDLHEVATIFQQLLDAVEYAHEEGLIHRDIKSSNVLLDSRRSGPPYVYLADFGLVRPLRNLELEEAGKPIPLDQVPGTPHYMAPEQTRGIITPATDIYALGVLLYQLLVGELPYDDPDDVEVVKMHLYAPVPAPCERDASIPVELGEVVSKAMAKRPEERFASIAEMRKGFLAAIDGPVATIDEDELHEGEEVVILPPARRLSRALLPEEPPETLVPMPVKRRPRAAAPVPPVLPPAWARPRRPLKEKRRRFIAAVVGAALVPVLLLAVLVARVLGYSLLPASVPILGASPVATVSVTLQSRQLRDNYVLSASPRVVQPDLATREIPDRLLSATASTSRVTATSGTKTIPGAQAQGSILFDNSGRSTVPVQQGTMFTTGAGVQVELTQSVVVPPQQDGADGTVTAPAVAALPGAAGNIPAYALNATCCNAHVTISNPAPFSGGMDPHVVHVVAQADLDAVRASLTPALQQQALQGVQGQLGVNEVKVEPPAFIIEVVADKPAGAQVDQVNVRVSVTATAAVYNIQAVRQLAQQLLSKQAMQMLGNTYQLKGTMSVATPQVLSQGKNGIIYLSVSVLGLWIYHLSSEQINTWRQSIKGATPTLAKAYIAGQRGVAAVQIQLPFGMDHLPASIDQIQIVLVNV